MFFPIVKMSLLKFSLFVFPLKKIPSVKYFPLIIYEITKIDIIKDGAFLQTIEPEENQSSKSIPKEQLFFIEDMNFDGIKDFRLMEFLPAAPNVPYLFFIYNPETGLFENNSEYRKITSPIFDHEKQQINSTWRNGCCEHARDIYVLKNGIPKLTERFVIGHNSQNKEYSEYWKVEDGKLQLVKEKVE